ncbi:hypothetical protein RHMOL_Rhmol01G0227900 [Rhododendron molle]|uniref:Uncharacterized protein n=1 Tax=Rhododendron molle TaxID=49168 RepID=A0ACC0Q6E7_RHOML|nr:hypothetical protein RHMOL_Rhmol01G0227900 [Rhododendron molle]
MVALMAKMAKLEEAVSKPGKISAGGIDLDRLCLYPNAKLLDKFKIPDLVKFDGRGDPNTHLYGYHAAMKLLKVESEAMSQLFPQTLSGPAFHWFLSLDISKRRTWEDIGAAFIAQYNYNSQLKMTTRELESTKMEAKESFADFVKMWRAKATLMTERPSERDQFRIISRNLQSDYARHLVLAQAFANFEIFFDAGLAIEDALQSGILSRGESSSSNPQKSKSKAYSRNSSALFGGSNYASTATSGDNAAASSNHTTDVNPVQNAQSYRARTQPQSFSVFEAPLSAVMEKFVKSGHLKPLTPTSPPKVLPAGYNPNLFCAFHQMPGHHTDKCYRLRHEIQDLIYDGTVQVPPKPNIISNSLPQHGSDPLVGQVSITSIQITRINPSSTIFNPSHYIVPANQPKPIVSIPSEPEVNMMAVGWAIEVFTTDIWFDSDEGLAKEKTDWLRSIDQRSIE